MMRKTETGSISSFWTIEAQRTLNIDSQMASSGVIFSDGMIDDFIEFNSGSAASIKREWCATD